MFSTQLVAVLLASLTVHWTRSWPINGASRIPWNKDSPTARLGNSVPEDMPPGIYEPMLQFQMMRYERSVVSSEEQSEQPEGDEDLLIHDATPDLDSFAVVELVESKKLPAGLDDPVSRSKRAFWDPYVEWWCTNIKLWCSNWKKAEATTPTTTQAPCRNVIEPIVGASIDESTESMAPVEEERPYAEETTEEN